MALTDFQRSVCRLIARSRIASGERYVAGGAALNEVASPRFSRDVDLFHDTDTALEASWKGDRKLLEDSGFRVLPVRERPSFVEAEIARGADSTSARAKIAKLCPSHDSRVPLDSCGGVVARNALTIETPTG